MSAPDQTAQPAQDGNKNIEFVTLFLTVLTITLTVTGLILAVWGVESLSKVEEMVDERLSRELNAKSAKLSSQFVRKTNDMNQFMYDMLAASIAEFDRRRESLPRKDIPDSTVQQNINNRNDELYNIKWSQHTPMQEIEAKMQQACSLFAEIAAAYTKHNSPIRIELIEAYYGHLKRYTEDRTLVAENHKQVLTELNKYSDLSKIRRYPNRFDQARLWQLRSQIEFNLGEKKQAIQSIQNALNLARLNQYLYYYLSYIKGDQDYATQQNDLIRAILLADLHHKSGELAKLHENKRKLIRKYPMMKSDIEHAADKIEPYLKAIRE